MRAPTLALRLSLTLTLSLSLRLSRSPRQRLPRTRVWLHVPNPRSGTPNPNDGLWLPDGFDANPSPGADFDPYNLDVDALDLDDGLLIGVDAGVSSGSSSSSVTGMNAPPPPPRKDPSAASETLLRAGSDGLGTAKGVEEGLRGDFSRQAGAYVPLQLGFDAVPTQFCRAVLEPRGDAPLADQLREMHSLVEAGFTTWGLSLGSGVELQEDPEEFSTALHGAEEEYRRHEELWAAYLAETAAVEASALTTVHRWRCHPSPRRQDAINVVDRALMGAGVDRLPVVTLRFDFYRDGQRWEDLVDALEDMRRAGKIGGFGFDAAPPRVSAAIKAAGVGLLLNEDDIWVPQADFDAEGRRLPWGGAADPSNSPVIGVGATAEGLFSDTMLAGLTERRFRQLPDSPAEVETLFRRWKVPNPRETRRLYTVDSWGWARMERCLRGIGIVANTLGVSVEAVAMAWALRDEPVPGEASAAARPRYPKS